LVARPHHPHGAAPHEVDRAVEHARDSVAWLRRIDELDIEPFRRKQAERPRRIERRVEHGAEIFREAELHADPQAGKGAERAVHKLWCRVNDGNSRDGGHASLCPPYGASAVLISTSEVSVRWTGHLSAISIRRARCAASSGPSSVMVRSMRSILPSLVSQSAQSAAWIFSCVSLTDTPAS